MSLFSTLETLWGALFSSGAIGFVGLLYKFGKKLNDYLKVLKFRNEQEKINMQKELLRSILKEEGLIKEESQNTDQS